MDGHRQTSASGKKPAAFPEERQARILRLLGERGRVRNSELAELLGVTEPTIRKDVADLARQRRLHRTHGGAMAVQAAIEPDLPMRIIQNTEAKTEIAKVCLGLVKDGDAVYMDGGSTILRIAELMAAPGQAPRNVNVLTNTVSVAQALAGRPEIRHTVLGGTYRVASGCFVGPLTISDLSRFTVDVAFIGVTGLTEQGFTVADLGEAQVKAAAIDRARRVVVAMDHTKVGTSDFARVCPPDAVSAIVTDVATGYLAELCGAAGIELLAADVLSAGDPHFTDGH